MVNSIVVKEAAHIHNFMVFVHYFSTINLDYFVVRGITLDIIELDRLAGITIMEIDKVGLGSAFTLKFVNFIIISLKPLF